MTDLIDTDPGACVTAGELRRAGAVIPAHVPDCAWAPRSALRFDAKSVQVARGDGPRDARASFDVILTEPLRWVQMKGQVSE